ncbi:MAG: serine/threonine-protein kinase [Cyanobacteria bacterium J06560_6]
MTWTIGKTLRNKEYVLEKELGNGRFITYLARHKDGSLVVVKVLNDFLLRNLELVDQQKLRETFNQESVKLAKCSNPHIVKVGYPFMEGDRECIVMEYINGKSLASRSDRVLPEEVALRYIHQIGEALVVVHENELTHRDVKPESILIESRNGSDRAVLISFSLAVEQNQRIEVQTKEAAEGFAPPELYSRFGGNLGAHTDIYSLAATLYELLTGIQPSSAIERQTGRIDTLSTPIGYNSTINEQTSNAIMHGLELDPKNRPSSMRDWLVSLGLTLTLPHQVSKKIKENSTLSSSQNSTASNTNNWWTSLNFDNKAKVIGIFIAAVAAIGGLLAGLGSVFKTTPPQYPTETPSQDP